MKTKLMILGAIAILTLITGACSTAIGTPKQTTIDVSYDEFAQQKNISKEIAITQGSTLIIELPSNPSTGFSWSKATISDTDVVKQDDSKYVATEGQVVGAAGQQVWTFASTGKGTSNITMQYSRPWEGREKAEWTFEITIIVK